jgi:hypothetical protein
MCRESNGVPGWTEAPVIHQAGAPYPSDPRPQRFPLPPNRPLPRLTPLRCRPPCCPHAPSVILPVHMCTCANNCEVHATHACTAMCVLYQYVLHPCSWPGLAGRVLGWARLGRAGAGAQRLHAGPGPVVRVIVRVSAKGPRQAVAGRVGAARYHDGVSSRRPRPFAPGGSDRRLWGQWRCEADLRGRDLRLD